ncbi:MAG TPA: PA14 domain-containing protein [Candidatus Methylacidiphilales bacterium]|nr:PA14 domain-containing protein [Candidatus Methylacidiphilales bacterium]
MIPESAHAARRRSRSAQPEKTDTTEKPAESGTEKTDATPPGAPPAEQTPPKRQRPSPPGIEISFQLQQPSQVSLGIYAKGSPALVRTILSAEPLKTGVHTVIWDGLDAAGKPAKPGEYEWRMLSGPGIISKYLFSLGTSVGYHPWPGQHGGLTSVTSDGANIFVSGGMSEGAPQTAGISMDGTWRWASPAAQPWSSGIDLTCDGTVLYALNSTLPTRVNRVAVLDAATGAPVRTFMPAQLWRNMAVAWEEEDHFPAYTQDQGHGWEAGPPSVPGAGGRPAEPRRLPEGVASLVFVRDAPSGSYVARLRMADDEKAQGPQPAVRILIDGREAAVFPASDSPRKETSLDFPVESRRDAIRIEFEFTGNRQNATWRLLRIGLMTHAEHLASSHGHLVAATSHGGIMWINPADGQPIEQIRHTADILDLDVAVNGDVYFISEGKVFMVDMKRKSPEEVITAGLQSPKRIALDKPLPSSSAAAAPADVRIWIAESGSATQCSQIKLFDGKGGLLSTVGRAGGRKPGHYQPQDFLGITDITSDRNGGFIITEAGAGSRRTARFAQDGKLIHEWYGGQPFYSCASADPADPTHIWIDTDPGWIMEVQADFTRGTWKPLATYEWPGLPAAYVARNKTARRHSVVRRDLDGDGKPELLLVSTSPTALVVRPDEAAGRLAPVAFFSRLFPDNDYASPGSPHWLQIPLSEYPPELLTAATNAGIRVPANGTGGEAEQKLVLRNTKGDVFRDSRGISFCDANGNGYIEAAELRFSQAPLGGGGQIPGLGGILLLDNDFTLYTQGLPGSGTEVSTYQSQSKNVALTTSQTQQPASAAQPAPSSSPLPPVLPDVRATQVSATSLDSSTPLASATASDSPAMSSGIPGWDIINGAAPSALPRGIALIHSPSGDFYHISHNTGGDGFLVPGVQTRGHGSAWPSTLLDATCVTKLDSSGKILWRNGFHAIGWRDGDSRMHYPTRFAGFAHGFVGVCDRAEHPCLLWSEDGLALGDILAHPAQDGLPPQVYTWWRTDLSIPETLTTRGLHQYDMALGGSLIQLPDNKAIWIGSGWNNCPVYEITGWDENVRVTGAIKLARAYPSAIAKGNGLRGEYFATLDPAATQKSPDAKVSAQPKPVVQRLDERVWFAPRPAAPLSINTVSAPVVQPGFTWPTQPALAQGFVVRWTGTIEPRYSEEYTFATYYQGARLIIDGVPLLSNHAATRKQFTEPLLLHAGKKYNLTLEAIVPRPATTELHLSWQSLSQPLEHIPTSCLYAPPGTKSDQPSEAQNDSSEKSSGRKRRR